MLKFFTLLNLTGLFLFRALFLTDVMITHETPATMQAGTEVKVTVTIDKGQLAGFAKLQIDLPEGLSATAIETKGASFTYAEGKAKFIWMALPSQPQFSVSYTLTAAANATGTLPVNGKFSYIEDNERKSEDLATTTVTITGAAAVAQDNSTTDPMTITPANANDVSFAGGGAPVASAEVATLSGVAPQQGAGGVSAVRSISAVSESEMLVEVTVNKGELRGFGKLQETIPDGFTALEKNSNEAIFTNQGRVVKFVWLNLPASHELKVSYKLRANGAAEGEHTVNGEFGYLLNDETQKAVVGSTTFFTGPKAMESLAQQTAQTTQAPEVTEPVKTAVVPQVQETKVEAPDAAAKPKKEAPAKTSSSIPSPETGVTYKVQIMAAHREVGGEYFAQTHSYMGDFGVERHEGWIKYVTGRYADYRAARDQRNGLVNAGHNFPGPFVTAYNSGERITVQEALMVSNQKWVQ
jgi:hypothetical protein